MKVIAIKCAVILQSNTFVSYIFNGLAINKLQKIKALLNVKNIGIE